MRFNLQMLRCLPLLVAVGSVAVVASCAKAVVLYDGSLGTSPAAQSLPYGAFPPSTYYTVGATSTTLDTTGSNSIYAGFTTAAVPLDSAAGFTVRVDAKILLSTAASTSRAGFSIIALDSNKHGIELGLHGNEIFAQDDGANLFIRAENVSYDTTAALTRYDLSILGNVYTLRANGAAVLSGSTRDYTPFNGLIDPYETPNFLFFGDDTTSASGSTQLARVEVIVPEPASVVAAILTLPLLRRRRG